MNARPSNSGGGFSNWLRKHPGSALIYFVFLPMMACLVLILPPIALPSRLGNLGYTSVNSKGVTIDNSDGAQVTIPENAVKNATALRLTTTSLDSLSSAQIVQPLPSNVDAVSPVYQIEVQGEKPIETQLTLPLPLDAEPYETLDVFALYNQRWFKIPFSINLDGESIESNLNFTPQGVIVVQTNPRAPVIASDLQARNALPEAADNVVVEVNPAGLQLADGGGIAGEPLQTSETNATSNFAVVPTITNVDANGARTDLTGNMMETAQERDAHISALVDLAVHKVYRGYNVAYEGLSGGDQELFTAFVKQLASALHAQQKTLTVTLPAPVPISEDEFDTAGYNWALIGRYADQVKIPLLSDPNAFDGEPSLQDQYLAWAVRQIDRSKIQLIASTEGRDSTSDTYTPVSFGDALKLVGAVSVPPNAQPGSQVELEMSGLKQSGGIQVHEPSGLFYFNYTGGDGKPHTVWLENADSLSRKIALALKYNLGGVALANYDTKTSGDERIWTVLENYRSMQPTVVDNQLQLVWQVDGKEIGKTSVQDPRVTWQAPKDSGQHNIQVALSVDGGLSAGLPVSGVIKLAEAKPTAAPTEVPPPTDKPAANPKPNNPKPTTAAPAGDSNPAPAPTKAPAPPAGGGNFAGKNLFAYGIQLDWTNKDRDSELGQVQAMGFNWAKIQVRWCDMEGSKGNADLGSTDDFVGKANARGVKVIFSVVCAPAWSRSDGGAGGSGPPDNMNDAADFMAGLASRYCGKGLGAIEVWNEHNLLTEWHGKPLSAALYMDMLKAAYPRIKAACPDVVVVSGAPTPTGWNDGVVAIDDGQFLEQMYQNGLKENSDAIGAHPSGFNVPALCNIMDPACNRPEASFRAPFDSRHHSWGFLGTMLTYRQIMVAHGDGNKQIWPTEFGWPTHTGGTCGSGPCHPAGSDNSPEQAGQWYVEAYQWAKQQGWVGVMTAWQLDFDRGELDAFRIAGKPAFDALAGMPK